MNIDPTAPDLDPVFGEQLAHCAHELAPRVNLEELRPPQGAPFVNPSQAIGDHCRSLANQGLSVLVAACDVNDCGSVAVVWQKEQVGLVDLVWRDYVDFWSWYVPWGREVDLPDGLLLKPVLGLLLSHLCCGLEVFDRR